MPQLIHTIALAACLLGLSSCSTNSAAPQVKHVDSAFKEECPDRRKLKDGADLQDVIDWARSLATDYDECKARNAAKIRALEIMESQANRV